MRAKYVIWDPKKTSHEPIKVEGWLGNITAKDNKRYMAIMAKHNTDTDGKYLLLPQYVHYRDLFIQIPVTDPREQFLKLFDDDTYPLSRDEAATKLDGYIKTESVDHLHVFCQFDLIGEFLLAFEGIKYDKNFKHNDSIETVDYQLAYALDNGGRYPGHVIGVLDRVENDPKQLLLKHITEAAFEHPDYSFRAHKQLYTLDSINLSDRPAMSALDIWMDKEKYLNQIIHLKGFMAYDGGHHVVPHFVYYNRKDRKHWHIAIIDSEFQSKYNGDNLSKSYGAPPYLAGGIRIVGKLVENEFRPGGLALINIEAAATTSEENGLYIWKL